MQLRHPLHQPMQSCLFIIIIEKCTAKSDAEEDYRQEIVKNY